MATVYVSEKLYFTTSKNLRNSNMSINNVYRDWHSCTHI